MTDLAALTAEDFTPLIGQRFDVPDGPEHSLRLDSVTVGAEGASRRQFALLFRGGPESPWQQGVVALEHTELGRIDIFVVPLGPDAEGQRYEAVFT